MLAEYVGRKALPYKRHPVRHWGNSWERRVSPCRPIPSSTDRGTVCRSGYKPGVHEEGGRTDNNQVGGTGHGYRQERWLALVFINQRKLKTVNLDGSYPSLFIDEYNNRLTYSTVFSAQDRTLCSSRLNQTSTIATRQYPTGIMAHRGFQHYLLRWKPPLSFLKK